MHQVTTSNPAYTGINQQDSGNLSAREDESCLDQCVRWAKKNKVKVICGAALLVGLTGGAITLGVLLPIGSAALLANRNITVTPSAGAILSSSLPSGQTTETIMMGAGAAETLPSNMTPCEKSRVCASGSPIPCTAPVPPPSSTTTPAAFSGTFANGDGGSHFGRGTFNITADCFSFEGELSRIYAYAVYLSPTFVASKQEVLDNCDMVRLGCIREQGDFSLPIPEGIDPANFTTAVVWCEAAQAFITSGRYQQAAQQA